MLTINLYRNMFQFCIVVVFLSMVPKAHLFKSNYSIRIDHLVDELNNYVKSELRQKATWPAGNHFIGPGHRFAIHDRYCGDFSTMEVREKSSINATYNKRTDAMIYQCDIVLGSKILYFGFILDMNVVGQKWESSDVKIHANENGWDISFEVLVRKDGFCKVHFGDSSIAYLGNYEVVIEPQNHFIRQWFLWLLTRGIVWSYSETWNEMLKGTVREEFNRLGFTEIICKEFTPRNP